MADYTCCLTTYSPRANNVPEVLNMMRKQTCPPARFILTLARKDEHLRELVAGMPDVHVHIVEQDTGVWKKWMPATKLLSANDLVFTLDDDLLLPPHAVAEFMDALAYDPQRPVSGNHYWHNGLKCHCGACSLIRPRYYAGWENYYELWRSVQSSDIFYTMLAANNHFTYSQTQTDWTKAGTPFNECVSYSRKGMVQASYEQLARIFGWIK